MSLALVEDAAAERDLQKINGHPSAGICARVVLAYWRPPNFRCEHWYGGLHRRCFRASLGPDRNAPEQHVPGFCRRSRQ